MYLWLLVLSSSSSRSACVGGGDIGGGGDECVSSNGEVGGGVSSSGACGSDGFNSFGYTNSGIDSTIKNIDRRNSVGSYGDTGLCSGMDKSGIRRHRHHF